MEALIFIMAAFLTFVAFLCGYGCGLKFARHHIENARRMGEREGRNWAIRQQLKRRN